MAEIDGQVQAFRESFARVKDEIGRVVVGHSDIVEGVLTCLVAGGHVLLEGVPGLGKTLLVRTLAQTLDLSFGRVQFTPDLMPADISGTNILVEEENHRRFQFQPGPVFAHIVLADEINRATPKTQSALLEAMQEQSVTVAGTLHRLPDPFFVLATQNPIEMEGTYPLPEAQLDRFLFKLVVPLPTLAEMGTIVDRTTGVKTPEATRVLTGDQIRELRTLARAVPVAPHVRDYASGVVLASHPQNPQSPDITKRYVRAGASPRGAQSIILAAKIRALLENRYNVAVEDINRVALPALRHRVLLNYEAEADGIGAENVVQQVTESVAANLKFAVRV
jgi:MoxR-like ATPase